MSNEQKQITFTFKVDEQTLGRLKNEIRDITQMMQKLVSTASGMGGGGRGGPVTVGGGGGFTAQGAISSMKSQQGQGTGGLAQAFVDAGKSMKDMANISRDSLRVMSDGVRRAIDEQKRSLEGLDRDIKKIIDDYDQLASKKQELSGHPASKLMGAQLQGQMDVLSGQLLSTQQTRAGAASSLTALQQQHAAMQGGVNPPPPGNAAAPAAGAGGGMSWFPSGLKGMVRMGGLIMGGANAILDESLAGNRFEATAQSARAHLVRGHMQAMRGGDYRLLYAAHTLDSEAQAQLAAQTSGFSANAEQVRAGLGQAVNSTVGALPVVGNIASTLGITGKAGPGGVLGGFTTTVQQSNMAGNALDQLQARADAQLMEGLAMQKFQSTIGSRVAMQRMLGLGGLGTTRTRRPRQIGNAFASIPTSPYASYQPITETVDPYAEVEYNLMRRGYDPGEFMSATAGLRQAAGARFAGQYGDEAMRAAGEGLGGYSELLGAAGRSGGGAQFARTAIGGGIDRFAGVQLGQAIIGQGFDPTGTTSGLGLLEAAQLGGGFTGGADDFRRVQGIGAGVGLGSSVLQGGIDPYQQGRNLSIALGIHPGGDVYSQDYLANGMNLRQMADAVRTGQLTDTAKSMGLSVGDIRKQLGGSVSSVLRDRMPGVDPDSAMGRALMAFEGSGQDLPAYLSGLTGSAKEDAVRNLGVAYGIGSGGGEEAGKGLLSALAGIDSKDLARQGGVGRSLTGVEKTDAEARAETEKKINDEMLRISSGIAEAAKSMPESFTAFQHFGENFGAEADRFIRALTRMSDAIEKKFPGAEPAPKATAPSNNTGPGARVMGITGKSL